MEEHLVEDQFSSVCEDYFQRQIRGFLNKGEINTAFSFLNKEKLYKAHNVRKSCLTELRALVLRSSKSSDKDILDTLGELVTTEKLKSNGVLFKYPYSYILYGRVTPVKEGHGSALDIYNRGIEAAMQKKDKAVLEELKKSIQELQDKAAELVAKKDKKKRDRNMNVQGEEHETENVVVQDTVQELQDKAPKLEATKEREKRNVPVSIPTEGEEQEIQEIDNVVVQDTEERVDIQGAVMEQQFDVRFGFSFIRESGRNCYTCTENAGRFGVEKSLVVTPFQLKSFKELHATCFANQSLMHVESCFSNPTDGADMLVCEPVSTLDFYCGVELRKLEVELRRKQVTKSEWWSHMSSKFQMIFRDVVQGLKYLYSKTGYACGDLKFSIFVTEDGRGRILPNLVPRNERKEILDDITQLKDAIWSSIAYPFGGDTTNIQIATELERFLFFDFEQSMSSLWFAIDYPCFWTVEERIQFTHNLKTLLMSDGWTRAKIEHLLIGNKLYDEWNEVPKGALKKIMDYHEQRRETDPSYDNAGYTQNSDIVRFFVATYNHINEKKYKDIHGQDYTKAGIETKLRRMFPMFYVDMFECVCLASNVSDEKLERLSNSRVD